MNYSDQEESEIVREEDVDSTRPNRFNGYRATLHCPRTDDDERVVIESPYRSHRTQIEALRYVGELAGELLCRDCIFSTMTPVEVSIHRKELAQVEVERIEAYKMLEQAREELMAIEAPKL